MTHDLESFDGSLLALLEGEGSTVSADFIELAIGFGKDAPENKAVAQAWLDDAAARDLIRIDTEEGLVSITSAGRNRLIETL